MIFKDVSQAITDLTQVLSSYEEAKQRDKDMLQQLNETYVAKFAEALEHVVVLHTGDVYDHDFYLLVIDKEYKLLVKVSDHLNCFMPVIREDTSNLLVAETIERLTKAMPSIRKQLEDEVKAMEFESDGLEEEMMTAHRRLKLIMARKRATHKWFIQPVLLTEEDIDAFLGSVSEETLNNIMDDFMIHDQYRENPTEVIKEALTA